MFLQCWFVLGSMALYCGHGSESIWGWATLWTCPLLSAALGHQGLAQSAPGCAP